MHRLEETKYGYKLVLEGFLQREEVGQLLESMKVKIRPREKGESFPLLLDMRKSNAFPSDARDLIKQCLLFCKQSGMERNAVVLNSATATLQARPGARAPVRQCLLFGKQSGMERNAVVLNSAIATLQARRIAKETGIDRWSRYIDASSRPDDWEKVAEEWLTRGVDPETIH